MTNAPEPTLPAQSAHTPTPPASFLRSFVTDRRIPPMVVLGFSAGMPILLVYKTQSAWLTGLVPLGILGLLSELTLAYKLKFLWAPLLDRYDPPLLGHLLGRRRGWIVASQLLVAASLVGIAFGDPAHWLAWTVVFSFTLGFAGATQDITIDGWRITVAPNEMQALIFSWEEIGYHVGRLAAGAGALYLAAFAGWRVAYLGMAVLMLPGMIAAYCAPEPDADKAPRPRERASLRETIVTPIRELVTRLGPLAIPILLMVAGFRMPGYVADAMSTPLYKTLHYSDADIATVTKVFGFWLTLGGTFLASYLVPRIGTMPSLFVGTFAGSASHLSLAYLAAHGGGGGTAFWTFAIANGIDGFAYAFATVVLMTYMSTITSTAHAASQYALLTSLVAIPGSLLAGASGFVVERVGFTWFFVSTSLIGIPTVLLVLIVWRMQTQRGLDPTVE